MKTDDNIKNKAIEKYKEITTKSGDNSSKAQTYLDGLLKIPFGIYNKEPIIGFLNEFRTKFVLLLKEFNITIENDKLSSYEINNTLDTYSKQLEKTKQFNPPEEEENVGITNIFLEDNKLLCIKEEEIYNGNYFMWNNTDRPRSF